MLPPEGRPSQTLPIKDNKGALPTPTSGIFSVLSDGAVAVFSSSAVEMLRRPSQPLPEETQEKRFLVVQKTPGTRSIVPVNIELRAGFRKQPNAAESAVLAYQSFCEQANKLHAHEKTSFGNAATLLNQTFRHGVNEFADTFTSFSISDIESPAAAASRISLGAMHDHRIGDSFSLPDGWTIETMQALYEATSQPNVDVHLSYDIARGLAGIAARLLEITPEKTHDSKVPLGLLIDRVSETEGNRNRFSKQ